MENELRLEQARVKEESRKDAGGEVVRGFVYLGHLFSISYFSSDIFRFSRGLSLPFLGLRFSADMRRYGM